LLATSTKVRDDADKKLQSVLEEATGKKVSIAMIETERSSNTFLIYRKSDLKLRVNGLIICVWTVS